MSQLNKDEIDRAIKDIQFSLVQAKARLRRERELVEALEARLNDLILERRRINRVK